MIPYPRFTHVVMKTLIFFYPEYLNVLPFQVNKIVEAICLEVFIFKNKFWCPMLDCRNQTQCRSIITNQYVCPKLGIHAHNGQFSIKKNVQNSQIHRKEN